MKGTRMYRLVPIDEGQYAGRWVVCGWWLEPDDIVRVVLPKMELGCDGKMRWVQLPYWASGEMTTWVEVGEVIKTFPDGRRAALKRKTDVFPTQIPCPWVG